MLNHHAPVEPTEEMIEAGAQAIASWDAGATWPDSWGADAERHRSDARKAYNAMVALTPVSDEGASHQALHDELQACRAALLFLIQVNQDDMSSEGRAQAEARLEKLLAGYRHLAQQGCNDTLSACNLFPRST